MMGCDRQRKSEKTLSVSEIGSQNFLGRILSFNPLAASSFRTCLYQHIRYCFFY